MKRDHWEEYFSALKARDWTKAVGVLLDLSRTDSANAQVLLKLGDAYQRGGDQANAVASYHRAAALLAGQGFYQKALAAYKIILRLVPYDMEAMDRSRELLAELETPQQSLRHAGPAAAPEKPEAAGQEGEQAGSASDVRLPSLFAGLPDEEVGELAARLRDISYDHGQKVIEEGDSGDSLYIIKSGRARVQTHIMGKEIQLAMLREGDVFGEVSFLTGRPRTADVIASGRLVVREVGRAVLEKVIEKNPSVLSRLHEFFESRVRDTIRKVK